MTLPAEVEFVEDDSWHKSKTSQVALLTEILAELKKMNKAIDDVMPMAKFFGKRR